MDEGNHRDQAALAAHPRRWRIRRYLAALSGPRLVLWCYLLWYLVVLVRYFDPNLRLWLTSLGLSLIVGIALVLNARSGSGQTRIPVRLDAWATARFFMAPFCVSSFAALVKDRGFILVFSPRAGEVAMGIAICGVFVLSTRIAKRLVVRGSW